MMYHLLCIVHVEYAYSSTLLPTSSFPVRLAACTPVTAVADSV